MLEEFFCHSSTSWENQPPGVAVVGGDLLVACPKNIALSPSRHIGPVRSALPGERGQSLTHVWDVTFKDLDRHDELLGIAFVGKHDPYRPLAEHIAEILDATESLDGSPILES
jgi:hypothetical protein